MLLTCLLEWWIDRSIILCTSYSELRALRHRMRWQMASEMVTTKVRDHSGFLIFLVGIYVTVLVVTIGVASKFVVVGPLVVNGATLVFPITFIFNDVFTEVYGYDRSRKIIWVGL